MTLDDVFSAASPTGSGANGVRLGVKLDSPKKWDAWVREVHGVARRDHVMAYLIKPHDAVRADWYKPLEPAAIDREHENAKLRRIKDDREFQIARDDYQSRKDEYATLRTKYERQLQVLEDLTLAMKRSVPMYQQGVLNHLTLAHEVYSYLEKAYAPSEQQRLDETMDFVMWLEKADIAAKGLDYWIMGWKDAAQKLVDMGMHMDAHYLRRRFQQANKKINFETTTFLTPKALTPTSTLDGMIEDALNFYRANPPTKNTSVRSFAAFQGKRQDGSKKTYKCFCGENHSFHDCPYINPAKRSAGWTGDSEIRRQIKAALDNPRNKRGGAVRGTLLRLGRSWEDVQPHNADGEVTYLATHHRAEPATGSIPSAPCDTSFDTCFNARPESDSRYQDAWLVDPGSQRHMCNRATRIRNLSHTHGNYIMAGRDPLEVVGYCEALVRLQRPDGTRQNVWLSKTAFVPDASANLISTGMLHRHGLFLNERSCSLEDRDGDIVYCLSSQAGLWIAEEMQPAIELDWVHLHAWYNSSGPGENVESSYSSFDRRPTQGNKELWHRRLGHAGQAAIDRIEDASRGGQLNEDHADPKHLCARCSVSKFRSVISRRSRSLREEAPLLATPFAVLHSDLICPTIPAFDHSTVYQHDFCEVTKIHGGKALQSKADWPGALINRVSFIERQYKTSVLRFMTDDDPVLQNAAFNMWLATTGRVAEKSPPRTPSANGPAEVSGRMITWMGRTLCSDSGLPASLWPLFYDAAVYILNRLPTKSLNWQTPLGKLYECCGFPGVKPYIDHLRVYGCLAYVYDRTVPTGDKLRTRALHGWLVGYTASNIWKIWLPETQKIVVSRDVLFDENIVFRDVQDKAGFTGPSPPISAEEYFDLADNGQPDYTNSDSGSMPNIHRAHADVSDSAVPSTGESASDFAADVQSTVEAASEPEPEHRPDTDAQVASAPVHANMPMATDAAVQTSAPPSTVPVSVDTTTDVVPFSVSTNLSPYSTAGDSVVNQRYRTRDADLAAREAEQPIGHGPTIFSPDTPMTGCEVAPVTRKRGWDESNFRRDMLVAWFAADLDTRRLHQTEVPAPPDNWQQVLEHPFCNEWRKAAQEELQALEQKHTWDIVPTPKGIFIVPVRWVFTYKFDDAGYVTKFKARLCVRGDLQRRFGDIGDTRALTLAIRTFRFMMALAAAFDLDIDQMDVSNAFLHAEVSPHEEIFVACAPGHHVPGKCYQLRRALYGMVDSPSRWQRYLNKRLETLGFQRISTEACLYTNGRIVILYYVDDIAFLTSKENRPELDKLKRRLHEHMDVRDCGELQWFLGIRILRDREQRKLWLVQDSYIDRIVHRFGLENRPRVSIPLSSTPTVNRGVRASKRMQLDYLARIGSLLHPAIISRPDIAAAASILASFSANPSGEHMALAERCIVYLRDHKSLALEFDGRVRTSADIELVFKGASDASFADDLETRRSTEGYLFKLFGGPIDWKSRKQQTVTTSTTEAELLSLQHAAKELEAWRHLFNDVEFDPEQPDNTLECDNQQTVRLIALDNPVIKTNVRHIHISELWIRQEQRNGRVNVAWVDTNRMEADGLTKPLPKAKFDKFVAQLGMKDVGNLISRS